MKEGILVLLLATLLTATGLQFVTVDKTREEDLAVSLADALPREATGWVVEDQPLGATESLNERSERTLQLDSYVVRKYSRGQEALTVYIGYWGPGRMDTRMVAVHTPDRCWVENGWQTSSAEYQQIMTFGGRQTKPGEVRSFEVSGHTEYVYYWHLVGDGVYDYGKRLNRFPHPVKFVRDFMRNLTQGKPEQLFIRINANVPLNKLHSDELFQEIMSDVMDLGVAQGTTATLYSRG